MIEFALSVTVPIFTVIVVGAWLKQAGIINDEFVTTASNLVFKVGLPITLFINAAGTELRLLSYNSHIFVLAGGTLLLFALSQLSAVLCLKKNRFDHGAYIQGSFRGNLVVIGLSLCSSAYGEAGLAVATLPVAVMVILYNILSVYVLSASASSHASGENGFATILLNIVKNPLIIGILCGFIVNAAHIKLPDLLLSSGKYFSNMTLPLALLCIGASINFSDVRRTGAAAIGATLWKLVASPLIVCIAAWLLGMRGMEFGTLFLLAAVPTAAASFIMAKAMGGNSALAANIVVLSTLGSIVTITVGLTLLKYLSLI